MRLIASGVSGFFFEGGKEIQKKERLVSRTTAADGWSRGRSLPSVLSVCLFVFVCLSVCLFVYFASSFVLRELGTEARVGRGTARLVRALIMSHSNCLSVLSACLSVCACVCMPLCVREMGL